MVVFVGLYRGWLRECADYIANHSWVHNSFNQTENLCSAGVGKSCPFRTRPIMFTPTSLHEGNLLLSMQHKSLMGI